ncbi:MAG: methyltransferase domain-containing protein, partial [Candidatus Electrothrix sp. GM3_4]|nr:methyltransferase domain-containing protein [Candidatus Electrothrix sp. GM3_4]
MKNDYGHDFYKDRHNKTIYSATKVISIILDALPKVNSAIDFGCGVGTWLSVLKEKGVCEVQGLDGPWVEKDLLEIPHDNFRQINFEGIISCDKQYDLAISLEVAEHLSDKSAVRFVESLTAASDFILFSAAILFQGGNGHVNEQWPDYWADMFAKRGFVALDIVRSKIWNDSQIPTWYRQNILLYVVLTDFLLQFFTSAFLYQTTVLQSRLKYNVYLHFNHTGQV